MSRCSVSTASDGSLAGIATTRPQIFLFHTSSIGRKRGICYACFVKHHSRLERLASIARNMQPGIIAPNASYGTMTATSASITVMTVGYVALEKDLVKITCIAGDAMCAYPSQPQPHILAWNAQRKAIVRCAWSTYSNHRHLSSACLADTTCTVNATKTLWPSRISVQSAAKVLSIWSCNGENWMTRSAHSLCRRTIVSSKGSCRTSKTHPTTNRTMAMIRRRRGDLARSMQDATTAADEAGRPSTGSA